MIGESTTNWIKLPGLFFRWELSGITLGGADEYRVERRGSDDRGIALFAVYHRPTKETMR